MRTWLTSAARFVPGATYAATRTRINPCEATEVLTAQPSWHVVYATLLQHRDFVESVLNGHGLRWSATPDSNDRRKLV
jgi:hypothetical protein